MDKTTAVWDSNALTVGAEMPELVVGPISRATLALFAGASNDHHPIHIDIDYAKAAGFNDVFVHGMLVMAYLGRALTEAVPPSRVKHYQSRFLAITQLYETLLCSGRVTELVAFNGEACARLELSVKNTDGQVKITGSALVALV